jgi:hypothetical protein
MVTALPITTKGQLILLTISPTFLLVASIALFLRFWRRKAKAQRWGADDYFCLAALVVTYCEFGSVVGAVVWGGHGGTMVDYTYGNFAVALNVGRSNSLEAVY